MENKELALSARPLVSAPSPSAYLGILPGRPSLLALSASADEAATANPVEDEDEEDEGPDPVSEVNPGVDVDIYMKVCL